MIHLILIYLKERFSFLFFLLVSIGIILSSSILIQKYPPGLMVLLVMALMLFFFELRLMDEAKDRAKDQIAYPERPLSRGVFTIYDLERVIGLLEVIQIAFAALFWFLSGSLAGFIFLLMAVYSWHHYKNFYLGSLENWPYFNALTTQLVYLLPPLFVIAALNKGEIFFPEAFQLALLFFASFAASDVCRKLNPKAHPVLLTFIHYVGFRKSFLYTAFFLVVAALAALNLKVGFILWPIQIAVLLSLIAVFLDSTRYTLAEKAGVILLLATTYALPFKKLYELIF